MAAMSGARPEMAPASTSLWPARYLVHDWMDRSAPSSSARWFIGVAKVESMSRLTPRNRSRTSASARRSATRRYGLVGDSETISRVFPGCTAAAGAAVAVGSEDDVVARLEQLEQGGGDRRHAAGEERAVLGALQGGDLPLGGADGGVAVAPVLLPLEVALEVAHDLGGVLEGVRGGADDRRGDGVVRLAALLASVHGQSGVLGHRRPAFPPTRSPNAFPAA